jgi:hypothetical protein
MSLRERTPSNAPNIHKDAEEKKSSSKKVGCMNKEMYIED